MSFPGGGRQRLLSHEELIERGVNRREAGRMAVRASLQQVVEVTFANLAQVWLCLVGMLLIVMFAVVIWSQTVYSQHADDPCDMPLALMLRLFCIIVCIQACQREITRYCLCYDMARDGPVEPLRLRIYKWLSIALALAWPLVASVMLMMTHMCNDDLKVAVSAIVACYGALAFILVVAPAFFLTLVLCLVRRGYIRLPRHRTAAPEGFVEQLPTVGFDPGRFADDGPPGTHSSTCPVCLEAFSASGVIKETPCGHVFHSSCLGGWLQVARSCPLCRQDLTESLAAHRPSGQDAA